MIVSDHAHLLRPVVGHVGVALPFAVRSLCVQGGGGGVGDLPRERFLPPRRLSSYCDQASTLDAHFGDTDKEAKLTRAVVTRPVLMPAACAQSRTVSTGLEVTLVFHKSMQK